MCKHEIEHLIGTNEGIKCRLCGKVFKTYAELEADRPQEEKAEEKENDEIIEEQAEEKPKKAATKKKGAKK